MRAAYGRIYQDLKQGIEDGTYAYEELLPSQTQLVKRYNVAHNTVRKALAILAGEGYCQPIHGKGVRVIWQAPRDGGRLVTDDIEPFAEAAARSMISASTRVNAFAWVTADERIAHLTGFPLEARLLSVERIRLLDGKPLIRDVSYFHGPAIEDLTREQAERSICAFVEDEHGIKLATSKRTITMERANARDRSLLELDGCGYVAVIDSKVFDGKGILFEHTWSRRHPDCFCLHETITRKRKG